MKILCFFCFFILFTGIACINNKDIYSVLGVNKDVDKLELSRAYENQNDT